MKFSENHYFSNSKNTFFSQKSVLILSGILLFAFLLRLLCWYCEPTLSRDGIFYVKLLNIWTQTNSFESMREISPDFIIPPFPLYLMMLLQKTGLSPEISGVLLNLIMGSLTPIIIYGIAKEISDDQRIAIASALLMAVHPTIVELSIELQRDCIYIFFIGITIYFILCALKYDHWYIWSTAGLFFAMALLTRYETLELLPVLGLYFLLALIYKRLNWKQIALSLLIFFCSFGLTIFILLLCMNTLLTLPKLYATYFIQKFLYLISLYQGYM